MQHAVPSSYSSTGNPYLTSTAATTRADTWHHPFVHLDHALQDCECHLHLTKTKDSFYPASPRPILALVQRRAPEWGCPTSALLTAPCLQKLGPGSCCVSQLL